MKIAKKFLSGALALALAACCLTACGSSGDTSAESGGEASAQASVSSAAELNAEESAEVSGSAAAGMTDEEFARYLTEVKTCQYFLDDPVPDDDIETILMAGINAQSGMNQQNWHFSAVTSREVQQEIADDMGIDSSDPASKAMIADAPLAIIVSMGEGSGTEYDAGLATQSMNAAALALGYSTKIISSPKNVLNGEKQDYYRTLLGIPEDKSVVGVLLVGMPLDDSALEDLDGVTGATTRNDFSEMATIVSEP
ncbi:MAG: nitroreductase family protein [Bacteroidales bacterium]|nr:nitroreductase family protein [Bacteroidales bacterium]